MNILLHKSYKRSKTLHVLVLVYFLVSIVTRSFAAVGDKFTQGNLTYTVISESGSTGTVSVQAVSSSINGELTIPKEVSNKSITYNVKYIENGAFQNCRGLTGNLIIPNSVTNIGINAFQGCTGFTGSLTLPKKLQTIGEGAFEGCIGFTGSLLIPNTVYDISNYAFKNCSGFTGSLTLSNHLTSIACAFEGCTGFTGSLIIPNSVTDIYPYAFKGCSGFTSLTIPNSVTSIEYSTFEGCTGFTGNLTLPNSLVILHGGAFKNCSGFTGNLRIPKSIKIIEGSVFEGCTGFTGDLIIPNSVTKIEDSAFQGCTGFTGDLIIPNSVVSLGSGAFKECTGFSSLTISNSITRIGGDTKYISDIGGTFEGCTGFSGNLVIPNSVKEIGAKAFKGCSGFTGNLIIPNSVTTIESNAFEGCTGFTGNLVIPNSVKNLGNQVFDYCRGFTGSLTLSNSLRGIGYEAFNDCSGFTGNLIIPDSIEYIGWNAFRGCRGFTGSLTLPNTVKNIGVQAFAGCDHLSGDISIPNSVTSIRSNAFYYCESITRFIIPNSVTTIDGLAFSGCSGATHITLPSSITNISTEVQSTQSEITLPDVTSFSFINIDNVYFLSKVLPPRTGYFFKRSGLKKLYVKPSLYNSLKNSSEGTYWLGKFHVSDVVPITFPSDRSYITLCRDFDVDLRHTNDNLPSGVLPLKAYIVSGIDENNNAVILQEITYVPSRLRSNEDGFKGYDEYVGVLLKGTPGYTYYYTIGEDDYTKGKDGQMTLEKALALSNASVPTTTATFVGANDPKYVTPEETVDGVTYTTYGLKNNEFLKYSQAGYVPYNHAYLRIPTSSTSNAKPILRMIFKNADGTTSIEQIKNDNACGKNIKDVMYNLRGMKVDNSYHGVIIVNGHKYLRK